MSSVLSLVIYPIYISSLLTQVSRIYSSILSNLLLLVPPKSSTAVLPSALSLSSISRIRRYFSFLSIRNSIQQAKLSSLLPPFLVSFALRTPYSLPLLLPLILVAFDLQLRSLSRSSLLSFVSFVRTFTISLRSFSLLICFRVARLAFFAILYQFVTSYCSTSSARPSILKDSRIFIVFTNLPAVL